MAFDWRTLVSAISNIAPVLAQQRASDAAQNELAAGRSAVYGAQQDADKAIGTAVNAYNDTAGQAAAKQAATAKYAQAVRAVRSQGNASVAPALGGDRYQADTSTLAGAGAQYAGKQAQLAASIDAPAMQRQTENIASLRAGQAVADDSRRAQSSDFIAKLRAAHAARVDPWLQVLSGLGNQVAKGWQTKGERAQLADQLLQPIDMSKIPLRRPTPVTDSPLDL